MYVMQEPPTVATHVAPGVHTGAEGHEQAPSTQDAEQVSVP